MTFRRRTAVAAVTLGLCLLASATAQQPVQPPYFKEPPRTGPSEASVRKARNGEFQFNNKPALPAMQADMLKVARHLIYPVTDPKYLSPQDRNTKDGLVPVDPDSRITARLVELQPYIHTPGPGSKLTVPQVDYILFFGEAAAAVFRELKLNDKNNPDFLRVNAGQMLAEFGRSGAPELAVYVTELLNDPETRPELLVYALKAAEGLLAAYNPLNSGSAVNEHNHMPEKDKLFNLVKALERTALRDKPFGKPPAARKPAPTAPEPPTDPKAPPKVDAKAEPKADPKAPPAAPAPPAPPMMPAPPAGGQLQANPMAEMTPDQLAVFRYIRRAAVRALAQVRFPQFLSQDGKETLRPLHTLAKFAVQDASLPIPAGPDESAEAVIGLCNLRRIKEREVNFNMLFDGIAAGVAQFARPKTDKTDDKSLPWAGYAGRLSKAIRGFRITLDATTHARAEAQKFESLASQIDGQVLVPIFRLGAGGQSNPDLQGLVQWREQNKPMAGATLYPDVAATTLAPAR